MKLSRGVLTLISLFCAGLCLAQRNEITDIQLRKKLQARAQVAARVLRWAAIKSPQIVDNTSKMAIRYTVYWEGGYIGFSPDCWPLYYTKEIRRPAGDFRNPPPLPKLSQADTKRAQIIARRTCESLGLGRIASFKEVVVKRTPSGMYYPIVSVECRMKVNSPLPVQEMSVPLVRIELEPGSLAVNQLAAPHPVIVEPLKVKEDKEKAKKVIAEYAKRQYGLDLKPESMKVELCLVDWPEGDWPSPESKRLRYIRRWLVPVYEYVEPKVGQIWFDANTMKLLGVRENYPKPPMPNRKTPPP